MSATVVIRQQIAALEKFKEEARQRWAKAQSEYNQIEDQIRSVVVSCTKTSGKKHAGGGGGIPGGAGFWIECDDCGDSHRLTQKEFESYPGPITWVGTGN